MKKNYAQNIESLTVHNNTLGIVPKLLHVVTTGQSMSSELMEKRNRIINQCSPPPLH